MRTSFHSRNLILQKEVSKAPYPNKLNSRKDIMKTDHHIFQPKRRI